MSLDDKKEKTEWRKHTFERKFENTYAIEIQNGMTYIHINKVNKLSEWNLIHDIINRHKLVKNLNIHYSNILQGCTNTRKGTVKFKNFRILLDSVFSSTIVTRRLINKLTHKKTMWWSGTRKEVKSIPI